MKIDGALVGWVLVLAAIVSTTVGCGPRRPPTQEQLDEENRMRYEAAEKEHLIGFDSTGFPVYGVDEEGKPIYERDK